MTVAGAFQGVKTFLAYWHVPRILPVWWSSAATSQEIQAGRSVVARPQRPHSSRAGRPPHYLIPLPDLIPIGKHLHPFVVAFEIGAHGSKVVLPRTSRIVGAVQSPRPEDVLHLSPVDLLYGNADELRTRFFVRDERVNKSWVAQAQGT